MDLVANSLKRKVILLEKVCQELEGKNGGKTGLHGKTSNLDELRKALVKVIDELTPQEKILFSLYYSEELNLREIGEVLGHSEVEIGRLFKDGMKKVAAKMQMKAAN
jgi:RNA polymerase sigma factor for flagellar operon FliA